MILNGNTAAGAVDFGFKDSKGRMLGVIWEVSSSTGRRCQDPAYNIEPGTLAVTVKSARNGKGFGALQRSVRVTDLDAAYAEIARRASGTMRRYAAKAVSL